MARGSAPGERRGGRQRGTPNKATADIKALARDYGPAAIAELARMSGIAGEPGAQTEAARVACLKELLDRGYGRATQPLAGDGDASPVAVVFEWAPATLPEVTSTAATAAAAALSDETKGTSIFAWDNSC
jgi:hypothetical protein